MKTKYIYGINAINSLLTNNPNMINQLLVVKSGYARRKDIIALAEKNNINVSLTSVEKINSILPNDVHQGVVAKIKCNNNISETEYLSSIKHIKNINNLNKIILILDQVQDPHNFGAILRTANAAGVTDVIITKDNSTKLTATVSKVASGAAELTTIVEVTNLSRFLQKIKEQGFWVIGADASSAKTDSIYSLDCKNLSPLALIVGAEGRGLRDLTKKNCDFLVNIPMYGSVASLNVSVATGILLFELKRKLAYIS